MEVIILDSPADVAALGAKRIAELIKVKPQAVLGLATGSTPIAMYQNLIEMYQQDLVSFRAVTTFNLDEYIGISPENFQSYRAFMNRYLFSKVDIDLLKTFLPSCAAGKNPRSIGRLYEQSILAAGGIDLQVLGIGSNGHIGFNEPTSSLASRTRVKTLTETTVKDNSRLFKEGEFQPQLAMTMGIGTILDSKHVLLLATGAGKAQAVKDTIEGPLSAMCPASALQQHPRVTIVLDSEAASKLEHASYYHWAKTENASLIQQYGNFYELTD